MCASVYSKARLLSYYNGIRQAAELPIEPICPSRPQYFQIGAFVVIGGDSWC